MYNFHVSHSHSSAERCSDLQMKHTTQRDFKKSKIIEKNHLITKLVMTGSQQENILSIKPPTLILPMKREPTMCQEVQVKCTHRGLQTVTCPT